MKVVCESPIVISGFGVVIWYGSAASMLLVDATDCVYGGNDGMGPAKVAILTDTALNS